MRASRVKASRVKVSQVKVQREMLRAGSLRLVPLVRVRSQRVEASSGSSQQPVVMGSRRAASLRRGPVTKVGLLGMKRVAIN